jgi:hypothetical protein
MMRERVKTVGIGLIDRITGPFALCIDQIWVRFMRLFLALSRRFMC